MAHVCLQSADVTFLEPLPASIKVALRATVEATSGKQAVSFAFAELVQDVSQVVHASSSACFYLPREEPASLCFDANFTQADRVTSLSRLFDTLQSEPTAADMLTAPDSMLLPSFNPDCAAAAVMRCANQLNSGLVLVAHTVSGSWRDCGMKCFDR